MIIAADFGKTYDKKQEVESMAKYVDGFVFVVPKSKISEYKKMAREGAESWKKHGALSCFECMGEDLTPKVTGGPMPLSFIQMTKTKPDETVWFSFIIFKSRKHRDEVNAKVMKAMQEKYGKNQEMEMPFDMKRFAYGGFEVAIEG